MKKGENVKASKSKLVPILISIIIVLVLAYLVYTGIMAREKINFLETELNILDQSNQDLMSDNNNLINNFDNLKKSYDLLYEDIQKIYKSCPTENACKGHFTGVSWYCNNVGDEISANEINNASHICVCDISCNMKATEI